MSAPARPHRGGPPSGPRADAFLAGLLAWLNARFVTDGPAIAADTPLFARGFIDSMRILELIAWTERATGRVIPDAQIRMDNFGTPARVAALFAAEDDDVER